MASIYRYVLVDEADNEEDAEYDSFDEALFAAQARGGDVAIIAREFEYTDSELVWTPHGEDVWPPEQKGTCKICGGASISADHRNPGNSGMGIHAFVPDEDASDEEESDDDGS